MDPERSDHQKTRRPVHRSPRYPGLTFTQALERVRAIYANDKRAPASPAVVLSHLNLAPGSGPANRILSALKQYGLLEEQDGQLRVTDTAYKMIALSPESAERA